MLGMVSAKITEKHPDGSAKKIIVEVDCVAVKEGDESASGKSVHVVKGPAIAIEDNYRVQTLIYQVKPKDKKDKKAKGKK